MKTQFSVRKKKESKKVELKRSHTQIKFWGKNSNFVVEISNEYLLCHWKRIKWRRQERNIIKWTRNLTEVTKMWLETKRLQITKANFGESKMAIFSNVLKIYIYNYEEERFGFFREYWKWFCFWCWKVKKGSGRLIAGWKGKL